MRGASFFLVAIGIIAAVTADMDTPKGQAKIICAFMCLVSSALLLGMAEIHDEIKRSRP